MSARFIGGLILLLAVAWKPAPAHAGAWTRDAGHFYLSANYLRIRALGLFRADGQGKVPISPYVQHLVGFYGEVGLVDRWLTLVVDGTAYRRNTLEGLGSTDGVGDWRVGFWTGLITAPVRLSFGLTFGLPIGDPLPSAGPNADADAQATARSLPTGDGEADVEARLALGHGFGGWQKWPLRHYLVIEAGYHVRTNNFADAFVYRFELGAQLPWKVVDRFWLSFRINGVESFASTEEVQFSSSITGLGNGVSYTAYGFELSGRIWKGLGASIGLDSAFRARLVPAGAQMKVGLSWQY